MMANEREIKMGIKPENPGAVCSATGRACKCNGGRCRFGGESRLDKVSVPVVRHLRSAKIMLEAALEHIDLALGADHLLIRKYPAPEVRETRRKIVAAIAMIEEIGGELK